MKHTPGPWQVTPDGVRVNNPDDHEDKQVADCQSGCFYPEDQDECEANARLIAAAPEMFDLLNKIKITVWCDADTDNNTHSDNCERCAIEALIIKIEGSRK